VHHYHSFTLAFELACVARLRILRRDVSSRAFLPETIQALRSKSLVAFAFLSKPCFRACMKNSNAVSTWSLHHHLGYSFANGPGVVAPFLKSQTWGAGEFDIFQLPVQLAKHGYFRCEICHFHLQSQEPAYLQTVAQAFADAGVAVQTLLIDDGDLTNRATLLRDKTWIASWIEAAANLKAEHVRVIAGKAAPTDETLTLAVEGLRELVRLGATRGVKVVTENWHDLLSTPAAVHHVLDHVPGLGFMADTGNWSGDTKYDDLASIFARADLCHAKASFAAGLVIDHDDFSHCLAAAQRGNYTGPMTLIFHDEGDEWSGLESERQFITHYNAA
jgi:sugar phosphate isomerase/epimerase